MVRAGVFKLAVSRPFGREMYHVLVLSGRNFGELSWITSFVLDIVCPSVNQYKRHASIKCRSYKG